MSETIGFESRVAIVTGAGGGLGRSHSLLLAARGARVVVNDVSVDAAHAVVAEIRAAGGTAIANSDVVEEGARIVQQALDTYGSVDIVINNAGVLRDASFRKMSDEQWNDIQRVHLYGSYRVTRAAWPFMCERHYGRIIFTSSASGLYGNFGQCNYSAAKLGVVGLAYALAIEGRKYNIVTNAIAPIAGSKMTETILPKGVVRAMDPQAVSPLVAFLAHERCAVTGGLFEVGLGWIAQVRWQRSQGVTFGLADGHTPEDVAASWSKIISFEDAEYPTQLRDSFRRAMGNLPAAVRELLPPGFM